MFKIRPTRLQKNDERVNELFDSLERFGGKQTSEYLKPIRKAALKRRRGWKDQASTYISSSFHNKMLSAAEHDELLSKLGACETNNLWGCIPLLSFLCIISLIPLVVMYSQALLFSHELYQYFAGLTAILCLWLTYFAKELNKSWPLMAKKFGFSASLGLLLVAFSFSFGSIVEARDRALFQERVAIFESDVKGFRFISEFSKEHYGVELVLNKASDLGGYEGFYLSTVRRPSMNVGMYCSLNMFDGQYIGSHTFNSEYANAWFEGIMVHELAHCLDVRRDNQRSISTLSLAPSEAATVKTGQDYHEASMTLPTLNWREVVADLMTLGYFKVAYPDQFKNFKSALISHRSGGEENQAHNTLCWIQDVDESSIPTQFDELFQWADETRAASTCKVRGT